MLVFCLLLWVWVLHGVTNSTTGDSGRPKLTGIDWLSGSETHCRARVQVSWGALDTEHTAQVQAPRHTHRLVAPKGSQAAAAKCDMGVKEDTGTLFMREPREQVSG